jgi:hypothetical protein
MGKKLQAGALMYSIFITLFCATISAFILLYIQLNIGISLEIERKQEVRANISSALELMKDNKYHSFNDTTLLLNLFDTQKDSISIHQKMWGLFKNISIEAWIENERQRKSVQFGVTLSDTLASTALYLEDHFNPLVISQETNIIGNCYVPYKEIKTASIDGKNYNGQLIDTKNVFKSDSLMPSFQTNLFIHIKKLQGALWNTKDSILPLNSLTSKLYNSFFNRTAILSDKNSIYIDCKSLDGNIILHSSQEIIITKNCKLQNIICIAPKITIQKDAQLESIQVFAEDSIIVEENVQLSYPSILCLANNKPDSSIILLEKGATISGACIYLNYAKSLVSKKTSITIDCKNGSLLKGMLFNQNNTKLSGMVDGQVFTSRFIYTTAGAYYENYLVNADINLMRKPKYYIYPFMLDSFIQYKIVQWLN